MSPARFDAWFQSDAGNGVDPPGTLGPLAAAAGLAGFALADAGAVAGLAAAAAGAEAAGVAFLPGVALEAEADGSAVAVFGFGIDPASERLAGVLTAAAEADRRHRAATAERLAGVGVRLPEGAEPGPAALVAAGYAPSRHAARRRYFARGGVAWVPREPTPAVEAVAAVVAAGGTVALRPGAGLSDPAEAERLEHAAARLRAAGLRAFLVASVAERTARAPLAGRQGLAVLGGSGHRGAGRGPEPGEAWTDAAAWARLGGA